MKKYKILVAFILIIGVLIVVNSNEVRNIFEDNKVAQTVFNKKEKKLICIDPGHQQKGNSQTEPIAPDSASYKIKVSSGTAGVATKKAEYELNLEASLKLRDILESMGYEVMMTRETHDVNISNRERAILANDKNCDMVVRIHADSSDNSGITGGCILIPSKQNKCTEAIYESSASCAKYVNDKLKNQGFKINGIFERSDLTGFNWSKVPVILVEMGFMSNYTEDMNMSKPDYQQRMMKCIAEGVDEYFKN